MFKYEYSVNLWRDLMASSVNIVLGVVLAIGILVATLNLFTNIKISVPVLSLVEPTKAESIVKGYSNIPIEKIIELEKQL
jgi:branched-subunit amino acid permease